MEELLGIFKEINAWQKVLYIMFFPVLLILVFVGLAMEWTDD